VRYASKTQACHQQGPEASARRIIGAQLPQALYFA
jgi:hypothetical protein